MSWHLAPSLAQLRKEVNAKYPNRSKKSDGTLGDTAHASRKSDHNPNSRGSVNAFDITYPGVNAQVIINAVKKHPSANYVIFNRKIYSRKNGWKAEPYKGASPHTEHLHVSILQTVKAEQSKVPWLTAPAKPKPKPKPVVKPKPIDKPKPAKPFVKPPVPPYAGKNNYQVGDKGSHIKVVQTALGHKVTGIMSKDDVAGVKKFQRARPYLWLPDGIVGPKTYKALTETKAVKNTYR